jgi:hypothetical protein
VTETAIHKGTGEYILQDGLTGKLKGFSAADAAKLVQSGEWRPVTEEQAMPFYQERAAGEEVSSLHGAIEGGIRAVTGGVYDFNIQPGSQEAKGLGYVEQGAPAAMLGGEVAGTILPFAGPLKGVRGFTAPGILDAGGAALTMAARKGAPGVARMALSRAAGVGAEVAGTLALDETRRAHLEGREANYTRVLGGYGLGAMIPAMVLGTGVGLLEGGAMTLGQRALLRGKKAREIALAPGISEEDMYNALQREHGGASPGSLDELHAQKIGVNPNAMALFNDTKSPAGEFYRERAFGAKQRAVESSGRLAEGMNSIRDINDDWMRSWTGKQKRELVEKLMPKETLADQGVLREVLENNFEAHNEIAAFVTQQVRSRTALGKKIANEFALGKGMDIDTAIRNKLALNDEAMMAAVSSHEFSGAMAKLKNPHFQAAAETARANPAWRSEPNKLLNDIEEGAKMLAKEKKGGVGKQFGALGEMRELVTSVRGKLAESDRAGAMIELDYMKKRLAGWAKPDEYLGVDGAVAQYARNRYEDLRQMLENPMYWGERAALAQQEMNQLFTKRLARQDAFYKGWFKDAGVPDPNNSWRNQIEATPDSVQNIIGDVTDINHAGAKKWREHITETREVIEKRLKHEDLTPEQIAKLEADKLKIDDVETAFNETIGNNLLANQVSKLSGANVGWQANLVGRSLIGSVVGGIPGALAGAYLTNKLNPATSIVARAHLERILRQNEGRIERAVARLVGNKVVPSLGVAQAVTKLADEPREVKQEGYQKSIKEVYAAAQDPAKAREIIQKELGEMEAHMPGLVDKSTQQAVAGLRYSYDHAPAKPITTLLDGEFISPVSDIELDVWERLHEAAMDPSSILEAAADGELIPEAVDAAEAVAPEFVAELRMEVLASIAEQEMTYEQTVALATLFKMPVDMTTDPAYIRTQQTLYAARAQSMKGPKTEKSFNETGAHGASTMSKSDQLASGAPPS